MRSFDAIIIGAGRLNHAGSSVERLRWAVSIHTIVSELIPTLLLDLQPRKGEA
ncbi:hypothetical protein [Sphingomonas sanxanigenens]|uniref:Uncharacterized protein n=1 Tax=Sphingomonas sanxanigenens DSM 19645 = NX02 TaxID=1123269 RepID=W0AK29_9SPHN|nr:hypothetical protein [Sphingomonas sanxanigenens]AHE56927.1 hypothetical protein NX02_26680 [Sphingomonas sanxanigenens DSM 19645 = NX02]